MTTQTAELTTNITRWLVTITLVSNPQSLVSQVYFQCLFFAAFAIKLKTGYQHSLTATY